MLKFKNIFIGILISFILLSTSVFATEADVMPISEEVITISENASNSTTTPESIKKDLYIYNTDSYTLSEIVDGNIFSSTLEFVTNPKNGGGIVSGNLYVLSNKIVIGSDASYSDSKDKSGNYIISSVNSKSVINGNVYAYSDSFTLEAGSEIHGDLYIASTNVDIQQDAVIDGNVFITSTNVTLNGQIAGSAYITADNFNFNYFGYITKDLYLNSQNATLSGIVHRDAFVTVHEKLLADLRVEHDFNVNHAKNFTFGGEVYGNAYINAKDLTFKRDEGYKCIINGNLNCATETDITIPDEIVAGEVTHSEYVEMTNSDFSIESAMMSFFTLLVYVFVIVLLSRTFASKAIEKLSSINIKNIFISLGLGFISLFGIFIILIFLLVSGVGLPLALFALVGYLFVVGLGLPLLLHDIANTIKLKQNLYIKLLIVTAIFYIISLIPTIGASVVFITIIISIGRILLGLFSKNK